MARFHVQPNLFTRLHPNPDELDEDDDGTGLPSPALLKVNNRRLAGIKEGKDVLAHFPGPGESLHAVCTHRLDVACLIGCLLERCGPCDRLLVATLSYNEKNLRMMTGWLDSGAVKSLSLLCSIFFRSHKGALWQETVREFRDRSQRCACVHSHAKVVCLDFASGVKLCIEGSANLCGNGSGREQFCLINDPGLHDWHAAWINEQVSIGEGKEKDRA